MVSSKFALNFMLKHGIWNVLMLSHFFCCCLWFCQLIWILLAEWGKHIIADISTVLTYMKHPFKLVAALEMLFSIIQHMHSNCFLFSHMLCEFYFIISQYVAMLSQKHHSVCSSMPLNMRDYNTQDKCNICFNILCCVSAIPFYEFCSPNNCFGSSSV